MLLSIPHPRQVEALPGTLDLDDLAQIFLPPAAEDLDTEAARLLQETLRQSLGRVVPISRAWRPLGNAGVIALGSPAALAAAFGNDLPAWPAVPDNPEGYVLVTGPRHAFLVAETAQGRLWAVQTLRQMLRLHGRALPAVRISDAPAMRYRGILLDVARRKVPTLETLKNLVDTLSLLKLNMLQLQVEHTFQFQRHPTIGLGCGSLSCEDILELDAHCRRRGIELVPMLQSFGHMRNILLLEEYRHLAENSVSLWSLCPTDPASLAFMDELYEEFLPCFTSGLINIGCDETYDLGLPGGRSNAVIAEKGKGRVYVDFILLLHRLLTEKYGKRVMFWGDIVLHHAELVPELPKELIALNWDYAAREQFPQVDVFARSGLQQIICPGTGSWNALFPRVNVAWTNVANFVRDGKGVGALGVLNTDWGDFGHYNLLGNSFYSYAHGAEVGWAAEPQSRADFDAVLGPAVFGPGGAQVVAAIRALGDASDQPAMVQGNSTLAVNAIFSSPLEDPLLRDLSDTVLQGVIATAEAAEATLDHAILDSLEPSAVADMAWAADATAFAARKTRCLQAVIALSAGKPGDVATLLAAAEDLLAEHEATIAAFRERWYAGNRHSEIDVTLGRFAHAAAVLQIVTRWLQEHKADFAAGKSIPLPELPTYQPPPGEDLSAMWKLAQEARG
ncbi:MAG TPA: glycoside hydrolase family 20 zincin-like fold domain-containing protein [Armatimonadota bacterium]